ncbi:MAG TPA: chromosomal replication initiator protein DnaA [Chitinivibrionales bacterium]|nr:chromosomal replication initiator protein DnaA [Chitinivibrionales bacterium]
MQLSLWQNILSDISLDVDTATLEAWFRPLQPKQILEGKNFVIEAPNQYAVDFLNQHYKIKILALAKKHFPLIEEISFLVPANASISPIDKKAETTLLQKQLMSSALFNHNFTFESFVVGPGNEFAKSAAYAVAKAPGKTKFNPLLIYGGVGLGKTHLLQAVGNYLLFQRKDLRIAYSSSEEFYLNFIDAIKNNSTRKFSDSYKSAGVLLIDDIQFLSGKESTQEEFFFIFNTLYQNQRQIVLTSDRPPNSLKGLQDRLISRFQWGLCVDIQPPNLETRVAILKRKAEQDNLCIPENILLFIAENVSSNIRELEGIVIRLLAYSSITNRDITIELVKSILKVSQNTDKTRASIDKIIETVADYYKVPVNNIREKNRRKEVAFCRQIAMYIVKSFSNYSLKSIGLHFGGRDHSTVIHAIQHIEKLKNIDKNILSDIENIVALISEEK